MPRKILPLRERFESKYSPDPNTGCWLWTAAQDGKGYGKIGVGGKRGGWVFAHRASWLLHNGEIPDGLWCLHTCDEPSCVNPDHLYLGTVRENARDRVERGRSSRGTERPLNKLSEDQVREIRSFCGPATSIAPKFGVSAAQINRIRARAQWAWLD